MDSPLFLPAACAAGILSHVLYFNRGEHHLLGLKYLQIFFIACATAVAILVRSAGYTFGNAFSQVGPAAGIYLAGLLGACLLYRGFFNPLNKLPGPLPARFSSLWYSSQSKNAQLHKRLVQLHSKYGPFVRVGSNDLSCVHPEAVQAIYGHGTKCTKGPWYDSDTPLNSLHSTRSRTLHDRRRRIWSPAFSDKALRGYEDRIRPFSDRLRRQLAAFSGKPVNAAQWFNYFSFDVMGELAFGESFQMLENAETHWAIELLNGGMEHLALFPPVWLFRVLQAIPLLTRDYWKFVYYCSGRLDDRWKKEGQEGQADIPYQESGKPSGKELACLQADSRLIIVAGSDTTAATLTYLFYHLASDPSRVARIREETAPLVDAEGNVDGRASVDCAYLNGCINEALRLNPPVPSMVQRLTPPEGITIGDTYIPGGVHVFAPQYATGHDEKIYPHAESFMPERWSTSPELVKSRTAFAPFNAGVYGCIGKPLALLELRCVTAKLLHEFDIQFAPHEDGRRLLNETRDHFTLGLGALDLCFMSRKS